MCVRLLLLRYWILADHCFREDQRPPPFLECTSNGSGTSGGSIVVIYQVVFLFI